MNRRSRELALIAVAGGMLAFEAVAIVGALPVVRRALSRAARPQVRVIEVSHPRTGARTTIHRSVVVRNALSVRVAEAVRQALL
jgi:hypothetical protein